MKRLFETSTLAKVTSLNKMWDFVTDPENIGIGEEWFLRFPEHSRRMPVPSCWNMEADLFRYRGSAWYRTSFVSEAGSFYIGFDAVQNEADVYLDGVHLGNHYGGFLHFGFEVYDSYAGEHTLVVRVNNDLNLDDTLPGSLLDWYNYGGIARGVSVREIDKCFIRAHRISYALENGLRDARLSVSADVKALSEVSGDFEVYIDGALAYSAPATVSGEGRLEAEILLGDVKLWRIDKPNLYYVRLMFCGDDVTERIGFREIKARGRDILLNGEKIKLLGVNRHEEHPDFGFSMPPGLIKRDIDIARDMNCNAIRTSHYPNSQLTADYCDEVGMLFWTEVPLWNRTAEAMKNPRLISRALCMEREMILENYHHPSIIFIGVHNECATDTDEGYALTEQMVRLARELDGTRLVTYATNKVKSDERRERCFELCDVVSVNHYIGWYFPVEDEDWDGFVERYEEVLSSLNSSDKPFIMSEFGYAALAGVSSFDYTRYSEDYQADALEFSLNQILNNERLSGGYIWQMCDIRSEQGDIARPRGFNNKGVLDEYRRPKRAYRAVRRIYGEHLGLERRHYETALYGYKKK